MMSGFVTPLTYTVWTTNAPITSKHWTEYWTLISAVRIQAVVCDISWVYYRRRCWSGWNWECIDLSLWLDSCALHPNTRLVILAAALAFSVTIKISFLWDWATSRAWTAWNSFVPAARRCTIRHHCFRVLYGTVYWWIDIDGAFFGTTFPHMFLLQYPSCLSTPTQKYQPTIFGFQIHESSPYYTEPQKKKKKEKKDTDPTIRSV